MTAFIEYTKKNKDALLQKWVDVFYRAYPLGSTGFVRTSTDRFKNPIGIITQASLSVLYDAVIGEDVEPEAVQKALFELIQLRAVQDMPPSKAVGPVSQMKNLFKEEAIPVLIKENNDSKNLQKIFDEYFIVEARIDTLLLMALDYYVSDKDKIYQLRIEEIHRNQSQLIRWAKVREEHLNNKHTEG